MQYPDSIVHLGEKPTLVALFYKRSLSTTFKKREHDVQAVLMNLPAEVQIGTTHRAKSVSCMSDD
jgi:hypothetical protein